VRNFVPGYKTTYLGTKLPTPGEKNVVRPTSEILRHRVDALKRLLRLSTWIQNYIPGYKITYPGKKVTSETLRHSALKSARYLDDLPSCYT
jgi:hypothetical protein